MPDLSSLFASSPETIELEMAALGLLLAFVLSQVIAWVYIYTHAGLSYSRAFVQSIVLLAVIISVGMMVIGNSLAIAFGLIGALSVIRFRNVLKDTRDTSFIFATLVVGMATGTANYSLAAIGSFAFCLVLIYLHWTSFGTRHTGDGFVRFRVEELKESLDAELRGLLHRYCRASRMVSQRFGDAEGGDVAYRLSLRDTSRAGEFVSHLREVDGVSNVVFALQEDEAEV